MIRWPQLRWHLLLLKNTNAAPRNLASRHSSHYAGETYLESDVCRTNEGAYAEAKNVVHGNNTFDLFIAHERDT